MSTNVEEALKKYLDRLQAKGSTLTPSQKKQLQIISAKSEERHEERVVDLAAVVLRWLSRNALDRTAKSLIEDLAEGGTKSMGAHSNSSVHLSLTDILCSNLGPRERLRSSSLELCAMIRNWLRGAGLRRTAVGLLHEFSPQDSAKIESMIPKYSLVDLIERHYDRTSCTTRPSRSYHDNEEEEEDAKLSRRIHHALREDYSAALAQRGEHDVAIEEDDDENSERAHASSRFFITEAEEVDDISGDMQEEAVFRYDQHRLLDTREILEDDGTWKTARIYTPKSGSAQQHDDGRVSIVLDYAGSEIEGINGGYYMTRNGALFDGDGDPIRSRK